MARFRKRPIEVEAIQYTGDNVRLIWELFGMDSIYGPSERNPDFLIVRGIDNTQLECRAGYWIIPDIQEGTYWVCHPYLFNEIFEPVSTERSDNGEHERAALVRTEGSGRADLLGEARPGAEGGSGPDAEGASGQP